MLLGCHARGAQEQIAVELTLAILDDDEARQARIVLEDLQLALLGHHEVILGRGGGQHAVPHHPLERPVALRIRIEYRGIHIRPLLANAIDINAMLRIPLRTTNALARHAGDLLALVAGTAVAVQHADHHE